MRKICIVLTIGIPGAGKTTFAKKLPVILPQFGNFKLYTVIYDTILESGFPSKYKLKRQLAFTVAEKIVKDILQEDEDEKNYVIVVDDNMYLRSMRYEYYKLARNYQISFLEIHFNVALPVALFRNANRESNIPECVIIDMANKFEQPCENWERNSLIIDSNCELDDNVYSKFVTKLRECLNKPVINIVQTCEKTPISRLQRIDLILRKLVNKRIGLQKMKAGDVCNKKTEILKCIKHGQISVDDNLDDAELLMYLDTLF